MNYNKIVSSTTGFLILISCLYQPNCTPLFYYLNTLNLSISTILYHSSLEYYFRYSKYLYCYDRFSICLLSFYRFFDNQLYAFLFSLLSFKYELITEISYILGTMSVLYNSNIENYIIIIPTLLLSFYVYFNRTNEQWTMNSRLGWHLTQSLYIYLGCYSYKN